MNSLLNEYGIPLMLLFIITVGGIIALKFADYEKRKKHGM